MEIAEIQHLVERYGPLAVGVGSSLDNTGLPIFFVLGMGVAHTVGAQPETMLIAAVIGSVVGDMVTYVIGRYFLTKERILMGSIGQRFEPILKAGESAMGRWGIFSILLGRFIPYLGKILPLLAGSYKVSWFKVSTAVVLGSVILMGFFYNYAEVAYQVVTGKPTVAKLFSLGIGTLFIALILWVNNVLTKRSERAAAEAAESLKTL